VRIREKERKRLASEPGGREPREGTELAMMGRGWLSGWRKRVRNLSPKVSKRRKKDPTIPSILHIASYASHVHLGRGLPANPRAGNISGVYLQGDTGRG